MSKKSKKNAKSHKKKNIIIILKLKIMKKVIYIITVLFITAAGAGIFLSCEKEKMENKDNPKENNIVVNTQKAQEGGRTKVVREGVKTIFDRENNEFCDNPGEGCDVPTYVIWVSDDQTPPVEKPEQIQKLDEIHQANENNNYNEIINIIINNQALLSEIIDNDLLNQTINGHLILDINAVYFTGGGYPNGDIISRYVVIFNDAETGMFHEAAPINYVIEYEDPSIVIIN